MQSVGEPAPNTNSRLLGPKFSINTNTFCLLLSIHTCRSFHKKREKSTFSHGTRAGDGPRRIYGVNEVADDQGVAT